MLIKYKRTSELFQEIDLPYYTIKHGIWFIEYLLLQLLKITGIIKQPWSDESSAQGCLNNIYFNDSFYVSTYPGFG